jgi:hypothetical protein
MMSLPSRVVISLTFLTDSAEMRALPILLGPRSYRRRRG